MDVGDDWRLLVTWVADSDVNPVQIVQDVWRSVVVARQDDVAGGGGGAGRLLGDLDAVDDRAR